MPVLGKRSEQMLDSVHPDLVRILRKAIEITDFAILEGHRGQKAQEAAFQTGHSKVEWPNSKHNTWPSLAVDLAPYPVDFANWPGFFFLAGIIKGVGHAMGLEIRCGIDFDGDGNFKNNRFIDAPHFELVLDRPVPQLKT